MAGAVILEHPRPVDVLHDGAWLAATLKAHRRGRDGWRGLVRYTVDVGEQYYHWRGEAEPRRFGMTERPLALRANR